MESSLTERLGPSLLELLNKQLMESNLMERLMD